MLEQGFLEITGRIFSRGICVAHLNMVKVQPSRRCLNRCSKSQPQHSPSLHCEGRFWSVASFCRAYNVKVSFYLAVDIEIRYAHNSLHICLARSQCFQGRVLYSTWKRVSPNCIAICEKALANEPAKSNCVYPESAPDCSGTSEARRRAKKRFPRKVSLE